MNPFYPFDLAVIEWLKNPRRSRSASGACVEVSEGELSGIIRDAALVHDVPVDLVTSVIESESAFRTCVVSPKGAKGLMQLMPATARYLGVTNPLDPRQNVRAGTRFLKLLLTRYSGDLRKALAAYNAGPGRVGEREIPGIRETGKYVRDVMGRLDGAASRGQ